MWTTTTKDWKPTLARTIEGASIESVDTWSTLTRLEPNGVRLLHALCHGTYREHVVDVENRTSTARTPILYVLGIRAFGMNVLVFAKETAIMLGARLCISHHAWLLRVIF